jgi:hypothetical protein
MRATFKAMGISKNHWHEILKSCCIALNQIPRKENHNSPWELVHGYRLPQDYLKPIGTGTVVLNSNRVKGRKFEEKGQEGVLIGFNTLLNSYHILTKNGLVIELKHVQFLKNSSFTPCGDD